MNSFQPTIITSNSPPDPAWYMDSGATDHVASDPNQLTISRNYDGNDQLQVGNGESLNISHVGFALLPSSLKSKCVYLKNVLCVPRITKNLLSISKLTKDNNVVVEFDCDYCTVKDKGSRTVLLQGGLKAGLYQLQIPSNLSPHTSPSLLSSAVTSSSQSISVPQTYVTAVEKPVLGPTLHEENKASLIHNRCNMTEI